MPTPAKESMVPGIYYVADRNKYRSRKPEGCMGMGEAKRHMN
jgi:hypothetical protein